MTRQTATQIVEQAGRRMRVATLAHGACGWLVAALGGWLTLFILDNLLGLPAGLRLPLAVGVPSTVASRSLTRNGTPPKGIVLDGPTARAEASSRARS